MPSPHRGQSVTLWRGLFSAWASSNMPVPSNSESAVVSCNLRGRLRLLYVVQGPSVALIRHVGLDFVTGLEAALQNCRSSFTSRPRSYWGRVLLAQT